MKEDMLEQLKKMKSQLVVEEKEKEAARLAEEEKQRKIREKNKTFEELFNEHGMKGSKY